MLQLNQSGKREREKLRGKKVKKLGGFLSGAKIRSQYFSPAFFSLSRDVNSKSQRRRAKARSMLSETARPNLRTVIVVVAVVVVQRVHEVLPILNCELFHSGLLLKQPHWAVLSVWLY